MNTANNPLRLKAFTSSQMHRLMGAPKPRKTYIEECKYERRLGRSLNNDHSARPTTWGHLVEKRAFDLLGMEYQLNSKDVIVHPEIETWAGTPDGTKNYTTVYDIKCPYTLKSFCELMEVFAADSAEVLKIEYPEHYWQLISNSVLTGCKYAELIVYMPYQSELNEIIDMAGNAPTEELYKYKWINFAADGELPYIIEGSYYHNLNILSFEVPESDKEALKAQILESSKELIEQVTMELNN